MSEQEIYIQAMNRRDPAGRRQFLDAACAGNEVLRERIETLIRQSDQLGSFLEKSPQPLGATADVSIAAEKPGTQIGPYKLLQQIGEGGMGVVYNGAATHESRRASNAVGTGRRDVASMGPRLMSRGEMGMSEEETKQVTLQWGRDS